VEIPLNNLNEDLNPTNSAMSAIEKGIQNNSIVN
jgi:hypothetical protein